MEMFAAYLSREKAQPSLLITSALGTPEWVSPLECQKLAVGTCDFTCCQRNHKFGERIVPCDRGITRTILENLISAKTQYLVDNLKLAEVRFVISFTHWWLRDSSSVSKNTNENLTAFKMKLKWSSTLSWFDDAGISLLFYAVVADEETAIMELLDEILSVQDKNKAKEIVLKSSTTGNSTLWNPR